ncbi:MAG TPA: histidine kinase dimerization/phospho-acceptor domain-containing protein [Candidatus Saccharimonadales bacterium]|jgi:PAS domain-containing protein|nr:histidine kinase dimerization/phospho-acceptor domain-containing protein [Candidatus Saccharimonadales bacterium]
MLQLLQKSLHNTTAVKMLFLAVVVVFVFVLCVGLMRTARRRLTEEADISPPSTGTAHSMALVSYQGIIDQLREQQKALQRRREQELQQAAVAESIQEAVLSNLISGVIFFDRQGLVRQANRAARLLFGYQSPFSLHVRDIFRGITRIYWQPEGDEAASAAPFVQAMQQLLRDGGALPRTKIDYLTPGGQRRVLAVTATGVSGKDGTILGACCLVDDRTEIAELARQMERNESLASLGEISAGVVNDFKNSLATIASYAQMLTKAQPGDARQRHCAEMIVAEAESLARIVGQFLEFAGSNKD